MHEFLQSSEMLTDEELYICAEAARLWEDEGREDDEKKGKINNGDVHGGR